MKYFLILLLNPSLTKQNESKLWNVQGEQNSISLVESEMDTTNFAQNLKQNYVIPHSLSLN